MKLRRSALRRLLLCAVLLGTFGARSLPAADVFTKIDLDGNISVGLPMAWKVVQQTPPGTAQPAPANSPDKPASTLLLVARPADQARAVSLSLFRANIHHFGPQPGEGPLGEELVLGELLGTVLSQGFTPTETKVTKSSSSQGTPLVTAQIAAKNAAGEERVFTDTAVAQSGVSLRLFSSRPASDQGAADEINAINQSLSSKGAPGVANSSVTSASAAASSGSSTQAEASAATPSPAKTVEVPAASGITANAAQLTQDDHASFLLVEGDKGVGSGFLCSIGGTTYAITNAHVMSDNSGIKFKALNGTVLTPGFAGIAVGHDIVRIAIAGPSKPLEIMTGIDETVKIGDPVLIPGNAEGAGVVKAIEGKVVGIGPDLIEVDAPFVKGNSGSPIIHQPTGKVLGVATYYTERKVDTGGKGEVKVEIRRFGYRLDSVTQWEPVNWQRFYMQSEQVAKIWDLSEDFIHLFNNIHDDHPLDPNDYSSPAIQRATRDFVAAVDPGSGKHNSISAADTRDAVRRFFADLQAVARNDVNAFDSRNAYDYFRRQVDDETRLRNQIQETLTKAVESRMQ